MKNLQSFHPLKTRARRGVALVLGYLAVSLAMTYPLMLHFGDLSMAGLEDGSMSVWNLWWIKYSIFDLGQSPMHTTYLFYPDGASLVFHSVPKVLGLLSVPLQFVMGITMAYNTIFLLTIVLTGLGVYWLVYHFLGERFPAFLAGALFASCPIRWIHLGHLQLLSTMLMPVFILLLVKGREALAAGGRRPWAYFSLAGLVLTVEAYDTEYYAIFLLMFAALYLAFYFPWRALARLGSLVKPRGRADGAPTSDPAVAQTSDPAAAPTGGPAVAQTSDPAAAPWRCWLRLLAGMIVTGSIFVVLFSPMLLAARREIESRGDYVTFPASWAIRYSADILSFFVPHANSQYLGSAFQPIASDFYLTDVTYVGWLSVLLALVGIIAYRRRRDAWLWALGVLMFGALALGPRLTIDGWVTGLRGPFVLLTKLPVINSVRVPARFGVMVMLALAVLAAYGVSAILRMLRRRGWDKVAVPLVAALLLLAGFVEFKPFYALSTVAAPPVYAEIAASDIPGAVITLPLGWEGGADVAGMEQTYTEQFQIEHQRPMIGGMMARAPKEDIYRGIYTPVLDYLANPVQLEPSDLDRDPAAIAGFYDRYQVAFIVVHKYMPWIYYEGRYSRFPSGVTPEAVEKVGEYVTGDLGMEKFAETDELVAFRRR